MDSYDIGRMDIEGQSGGRLFAKGAYGCIYHTPLFCKNKTHEALPKNTEIHMGSVLTKLLSAPDAKVEFDIAKKIQAIPLWKQYYLVAEGLCEPAPISKQKNTEIADCPIVQSKPSDFGKLRLLKLSYGGVPLEQYRMNFKKFPFFDFAKHLLEGLALLTLHGITHLDLHRGNILVDSANIPRLIDFNLSIDKDDPHDLVNRLKHSYQLNLTQESPDFLLVNAVHIGKEANWVISDMLTNKDMLKTLRKVLGTTELEQRTQITEFYKESAVAQKGDLEGWFNSYWSYNDSWAGGCILVKLIANLSLWSSFEKGDFALTREKLFATIRHMTHMSPMKRFDSVQALAFLDPSNYIIRTYATDWLKKRPAV
jgi:hypothetical protein